MKKYIIIPVLLSGLIFSCKKKWLEVIPQGSLVAVTTNDFDKMMNNPAFYNYFTGGWGEAQLMGDEVAVEGTYFGNSPIRQRLFQWKDSIFLTANSTSYILENHISEVYVFNKVIQEVINSSGGTEQQKKALRAEALAARAWSNFNMVNYYCKPFVAATAETDPGFPIIKEADVNVRSFPRGTVKQSYDFIIEDLKAALEAIPVKQPFVTRMSRPAAEGVLGKVLLFMGRYEEALPFLNAALTLVEQNGQVSLYDYNQTLSPQGSFMPIDPLGGPVNGPGNNQNDFTEAVFSRVWGSGPSYGTLFGNDGLVLSTAAQALYSPSDFRRSLYTNTNSDQTPNAAGRWRKYGVRYSRFGLQLPELYLLIAECKARLNNLGEAVTAVETLRKKRMPATDAKVPTGVANDKVALVSFIIEERIREFAMEGYRWFDMRRLSVDPLFPGLEFEHVFYNQDASSTVFTLDQPNRLVMLFPINITNGNPDLKNNP